MNRQPTPKQTTKRAEIDAFFRASFAEVAVNGVLGDPNGLPAFAYLRVSTDAQAEEGRGGLPRQLDHIHEIAQKTGRRIEWANVYADDHSGFDLHRPAIDQLMAVLERTGRGQAVVMEDIDRLARDADWQGLLLKQMEKLGVTPVWWNDPGSPLMRRVTGAVKQQYMEDVKARMYDGKMKKAKKGRVINARPAFGYKLVDSNGEEGEKAREDTRYGIREDTAVIVAELYRRIAAAESLHQIARDLETRGVLTSKGCKRWYRSNIAALIRNPVYKGDYFAHRHTIIETAVPSRDGLSTQLVKKMIQRPEAEWIRVPVPPIVDAGLWQAANDMLAKNRVAKERSRKGRRYLLGGLVKCAGCGYSYTGWTGRDKPQHKHKQPRQGYECRAATGKAEKCHRRTISARTLDAAVWKAVLDTLLNPEALRAARNSDTFDSQNAQIERDVAQLEEALIENAAQAERLLNLYVAGKLKMDKYDEKNRALEAEAARLQAKVDKLLPQLADVEAFEARWAMIDENADDLMALHANGALIDPSFEVKQRLLKMCVDHIDLNAGEGWFELHGVFRGTYNIANTLARRSDFRPTARR